MSFYAHTAEDESDRRLSAESRWQLLKDHLRVIYPSVPSCHLKTVPREVVYAR